MRRNQRTYVLRPESITPLGPYLARAVGTDDPVAWWEYGLVLLLREQEFFRMYLRLGASPPRLEAPDPAHWAPHALTDAGRRSIELDLAVGSGGPPLPRDLFGLKSGAAARLGALAREDIRHWPRLGPALFQMWADLLCYDRMPEAARTWSGMAPRDPLPLAWSHVAAMHQAAAGTAAQLEHLESLARRARRLLPRPLKHHALWSTKLVDAAAERLVAEALDVRAAREPGFGRYLVTERRFFEQERAELMKGFDATRIPSSLRSLAKLARSVGVGDDPARAHFLARLGAAGRRQLVERVQSLAPEIEAWLSESSCPGADATRNAFFWLRQAAEEIGD